MNGDAELDAMSTVKDALEDLEPEARERVIGWAIKRFDIAVGDAGKGKVTQGSKVDEPDEDDDGEDGDGEGSQYDFFAELYDATGPASEKDKVLVAGYWQQKIQGAATFQAYAINKELKDLGHGVGHISEKFDALIKDKPSLVLQLKKSGSSAQGKKTYKLTNEGIKRVEAMIKGGAS